HFGNTTGLETPGTAIVVRLDGGFGWTAAGIGAAGGSGFVLVGARAALAPRRRQRGRAARTRREGVRCSGRIAYSASSVRLSSSARLSAFRPDRPQRANGFDARRGAAGCPSSSAARSYY